jgi:predicted kinase
LQNLHPSSPAGQNAASQNATAVLRLGGASRRLWTADRLDVRLRQARIGQPQVAGLATALSALHAEPAPRTPDAAPDPAARARAAVAALRSQLPGDDIVELERDVLDAFGRCAPVLAARREAARLRRLHGAQRIDGMHIDASGRTEIDSAVPAASPGGDPAEELAGLLVQLAANEQPAFARRLLAAYAEASCDYDLYPVIDAWTVLAALEAARAALEPAAGADRRRAWDAAQQLIRAPRRLAAVHKPARALVVAGLMASGKSTLSERLSTRLGAPRISGDALRAKLARQLPRKAGALAGLEDAATDDVYAALFQAAGDVLASGRSVVIDATFPTRSLRAQLRAVVGALGGELRFLECRVDEAVVRRRLEARARAQGRDEAEWLTLFEHFLETWEPVEELADPEHLLVDTTRDPRACLEGVERSLGVQPSAPHRATPPPVWAQRSA